MDNKTFQKQNILFIKSGCHYCRLTLFIDRINQKLPVKDWVKVIDCEYYASHGISMDPLIEHYSKSFDGFPTLFIKDRKIPGISTQIEYETLLNTIFFNLYIVPEENPHMWNEDCEFKKTGIIRGVVCK